MMLIKFMIKIFSEKFNSPIFLLVTIILFFSRISFMKVFYSCVFKICILRNIIIYFYLVIKLVVTLFLRLRRPCTRK